MRAESVMFERSGSLRVMGEVLFVLAVLVSRFLFLLRFCEGGIGVSWCFVEELVLIEKRNRLVRRRVSQGSALIYI